MKNGERIKAARERMGMSQIALADKIGVSKQTLYKYENDIITNIPSDKIEAIATATNTTPAYIMGWDDPSNSYYSDDYINNLADFLYKNPMYKTLFDTTRKVKPEDVGFIQEMIERTLHD